MIKKTTLALGVFLFSSQVTTPVIAQTANQSTPKEKGSLLELLPKSKIPNFTPASRQFFKEQNLRQNGSAPHKACYPPKPEPLLLG